MSDLPDFLSDEPASAPVTPEPAPVSEPASPPAPQPTPEPAPGAPVTAAPAQAVPAPVEPLHTVPLPTFLDLRDRATAAEKEAKELREWRAQQEAQRNRQPPPNRDEDPEAYEAHREAAMEARFFYQARETSRRLATLEHGKQTVDTAYEWAAARIDDELRQSEVQTGRRSSPLNERVLASQDPVGFLVTEWKREQVASKVDPTDYDAFLAWKAGGGVSPASPHPGAPAAPTPAPVAPRPSLAGGPSAGSSNAPEARDGEAQFQSMFGS